MTDDSHASRINQQPDMLDDTDETDEQSETSGTPDRYTPDVKGTYRVGERPTNSGPNMAARIGHLALLVLDVEQGDALDIHIDTNGGGLTLAPDLPDADHQYTVSTDGDYPAIEIATPVLAPLDAEPGDLLVAHDQDGTLWLEHRQPATDGGVEECSRCGTAVDPGEYRCDCGRDLADRQRATGRDHRRGEMRVIDGVVVLLTGLLVFATLVTIGHYWGVV